MSQELSAKIAALDHIKTVRVQLDELTRMLEPAECCMDVMKHIQTAQVSLEHAYRVTLHKQLETCFSEAATFGSGQPAIVEPINDVKFTSAQSPTQVQPNGCAISQCAASNNPFTARDLVAGVQGFS